MQTIAAGSHRSFARSPGHHAGREGRVLGEGERTRNPNCLGHRAANDNQRRQCVSLGGVSVHVLPMQHVRCWLRFRSNRTASVITQLLDIRPGDYFGSAKRFCAWSTLRIVLLTSVRWKTTHKRTWAATMEGPFSCEVGHASGGAKAAAPTLGV